MNKLLAGCFMTALLLGSLVGCGKWDKEPTLTAIAVTPLNPSIPKGLTQQFTATGIYSDGTSKPMTSVTWTSATPANATIGSITGLATGLVAGTSVMTATSGTLSGTSTLTVTAATLTSITVTPALPSIPKGMTQQLVATGHYSDATSQVLTGSAIWTSGTQTVATLNANGTATSGLATGILPGTSVMTATSGTISGSTTLTVTAATLSSIVVTPALPSIPKGLTQQFIATGHYSDLTTQVLTTTATWTSGTLTVATMNANGTATSGLATGILPGTSVITATSGLISGNTTLTVTPATLVSIAVTPLNPSTTVGGTKQFIATGTYSDLTTQILTTTAIWSSGSTLVATMNPSGQLTSGLATGVAVGTSVITATSGLISGNTLLTITAAPPPAANHLGTASTFGIMATSAITNTGVATHINGDVSLDPGTSNGLLPIQVTGAIHINDTVSAAARVDLLAAYSYYTTLPPGVTISAGADLGALYPISIPPGTYTSGSTMLVSTPLVFDGAGDSNATWVFQIGSSLTTAASITLTGGAQAKNIFWVCVQDGTVGVGTIFYGTIIAGRDVTGKTGAVINGRILAGATTAGTIALDTNTVNVPAP
jgi:hypothetical protein